MLVYMSVYLQKYVCQNAWAELCGPNMCMLKVSFARLKLTCDTVEFSFRLYATAALAWTKKKPKKCSLEMRNLKQTELPQTEEQRKERLRIRREKDRARRRTKKIQEEKKKSSETEDHGKQRLATLKRLK